MDKKEGIKDFRDLNQITKNEANVEIVLILFSLMQKDYKIFQKQFEILLNILKHYETRILVNSNNFNKLKYITNKQDSVTNLQLLHRYPQLALQKKNLDIYFNSALFNGL